jgi:hypothetical protein
MAAAAVWAQSYQGGIRGTVTDPQGAAVPDVKVTLINQATGVARATLANTTGEYVFSSIEPATYTISAANPSFKTFERKNVIVGTQEFLKVDVQMEIGSVNDTVMVTGEVALIENANASNGQVLDTQKMTDLPNLGRNPFLLSKLASNVTPVGDPRFNRFQDQSGSSAISIAGGPIRGNNYLIDGVPITDANNRAVIIPSIEATQEMKLQNGTYDATMGRTGGGVFNVYMKSGSNDFHGSLFGYTRQTDWVANNFFYNQSGAARPDQPYYTWGGSFGGPVVIPKVYNGKNKTFFWIVTESYRQHSPLSDSYAVPTALEAQGNYSQSTAKIFDPFTSRACTAADNCPSGVTVTRDPFPGNVIPASRINPVGKAIISYLPAPQRAAATDSYNYTGTDTLIDRADEYTGKADHEILPWWKISGTYLHYKSREPGGNTLGTLPGASGNGPYLLYRKVDATVINSIMTPNPTTVVSLRYGFNRFPNITEGVSYGFSPAQLGFPASYTNSLQALYFPEIDLLNNKLSSTSPSVPNFWSKNLLGSVSKFVGRHSITMGMDYRILHVDFTTLTYAAGDFAFNGVFTRQYPSQAASGTGADFADLLLGYPSSGTVQTTSKLFQYVRYYAGYFQDDIRMSSKLTVNLGLRYEYEMGIAEKNNALAVGFNQSAPNPVAANVTGVLPLGVLQYAGQNNNPTSCCSPSTRKFGPRVGAAYQLNSKTTLRGGFGVFYAPIYFSSDPNISPGYTQATTYVASNDGNATPANSLSNPFPSGVLQPVGKSLGALTGIGSTLNYLDQNRKSPIVYQYSFDIQRELPYQIVLEVGYIGSVSRQLSPTSTSTPSVYINQVPDNYLTLGSQLNSAVANPFYGHGGAGVIGNPTVAQSQLLKPFPEYSTIQDYINNGKARYDSMIVKAQKRMSSGLTFLSTVTWSRNEDNTFGSASSNSFNGFSSSPPSQPQDYYNTQNEHSLASVDTPIRFTTTFTYGLPFGKGKPFLHDSKILDYIVGGWQVNATIIYQNGFPLAVYQQNLNSNIGAGAQRPNATGVSPSQPGSVTDRLTSYINPAAFSQAPAFTFGNISRTLSYRGPGMKNWDTSIFKDFTIRERLKGQFRAEALNSFNSPLFANPNTQYIPGNTSFGQLTYQANFPRLLQLGVRFYF